MRWHKGRLSNFLGTTGQDSKAVRLQTFSWMLYHSRKENDHEDDSVVIRAAPSPEAPGGHQDSPSPTCKGRVWLWFPRPGSCCIASWFSLVRLWFFRVDILFYLSCLTCVDLIKSLFDILLILENQTFLNYFSSNVTFVSLSHLPQWHQLNAC